ncbi:MAG: prolyl oligopeptidase family serine peptidase [Myxococcaceae bacterium]
MSIASRLRCQACLRKLHRCLSPLLLLLLAFRAMAAEPAMVPDAGALRPPATPAKPVTDVIQGTSVTDAYRWLEEANAPAVRAWAKAQTAAARSTLDALPNHAAISARVAALVRGASPSYFALQERGGRWFALKADKTKNQPMLVLLKSPEQPGSERLLLDPNQLDASGATAIDFFRPSKNGHLVAVSLSRKGTERGDVHVYQVDGAKELTADVVPSVNGGTAGGDVAWAADGRGFFYTRYPRPAERPAVDLGFFQQVWFHQLGTKAASDRYELGRDFPRIAETTLEMAPDGSALLASVANGDGGEVAHFVRATGGAWKQLAGYADRIRQAHFGPDGALYLLSLKDAERGKILRLAPGVTSVDEAVLVAPEGPGAVSEFVATRHRLYVAGLVGGPAEVRVFDTAGGALGTLPIPPVSDVSDLTRSGQGDDVYLNSVQFTRPPAWFRYDARHQKLLPTALAVRYPVDLSGLDVIREEATSRDGTKVPFTVIRAHGVTQDGTAPGVLYGYGGYAISLTPHFLGAEAPWLEQGGVWVEANLRGGAEFGDAWHRAGNLTQKQNVFDDFLAVARRLVEKKYVSPKRLGIEGGSNGGLLMGAALTQAPELFRAVVSMVGIYDMVRAELSPNGAFNITEYGTVQNPEQFKALYAYSPYHRVKDGVAYPAVLLTTGLNDPRVESMQSFKMAARLQAASSSGLPVLLRVTDSGHGIGASVEEKVSLTADALSFFFAELGLPYRPIPAVAAPR